jgi:hypothetical protein
MTCSLILILYFFSFGLGDKHSENSVTGFAKLWLVPQLLFHVFLLLRVNFNFIELEYHHVLGSYNIPLTHIFLPPLPRAPNTPGAQKEDTNRPILQPLEPSTNLDTDRLEPASNKSSGGLEPAANVGGDGSDEGMDTGSKRSETRGNETHEGARRLEEANEPLEAGNAAVEEFEEETVEAPGVDGYEWEEKETLEGVDGYKR